MLRKLYIQNYIIIDEIEITFSGRLNVITGETGAGKSILMGALGLILGERAETSVLLNRDKKSIVEGLFTTDNKLFLREFLRANDLDVEEELTIRREVSPNGKSRAFVNDTPINLDQLRILTAQLVDLHQQFDSLNLGSSSFQLEVLDALADQFKILDDYKQNFQELKMARGRLTRLEDEKTRASKEFDYNQFLFNELEEAGLHENELETLDGELKLLSHSEEIKAALSKAYFDLNEDDKHVIQQVRVASHQLQLYSSFHSELPALAARLQSAHIELRDIADEIDRINRQIQVDPQRIDHLNERISIGYRLLKKHGLQKTNELIAFQSQLAEKLQGLLNMDEQINQARKELDRILRLCSEKATVISVNRQLQIDPLVKKVNQLLHQVGMPNARLKVQFEQGELMEYGIDTVEFLFDANKSNRFESIRKVASGGELSRLMLCIKSLVAESIDLPTMIFDEIDTGISGEAARQVGLLLQELAFKRQVICITHQPQIAGRADEHFLVYKKVKGESVKTNIKVLSKEERIASIAEMLSGEKPTAAALQNAREMISG
ncbi:MAG: DNA repair protein RecN [Chitinophagales bacterium]